MLVLVLLLVAPFKFWRASSAPTLPAPPSPLPLFPLRPSTIIHTQLLCAAESFVEVEVKQKSSLVAYPSHAPSGPLTYMLAMQTPIRTITTNTKI